MPGELLEEQFVATARRGAIVVCEAVTVCFRWSRRPMVVRMPGTSTEYRATRRRADTLARFEGALDPVLEEDLAWLSARVAAGLAGDPRPAREIARIDLLLSDGRRYPGCGIDAPPADFGKQTDDDSQEPLSFRLRHRAL